MTEKQQRVISSEKLGLALRKQAAARALGLSDESFDRYVAPYVPVLRRGRLRLYPVTGLERWLAENAELPLAAEPRATAE